MTVQNILKAIVKNIQREKEFPLWHGTGVSPQALMEGAESTTPKFSSKFFKQGTGGMVQGPGLYATEIVPVGKHYAELTGSKTSFFRGSEHDINNILSSIGIKDKYVQDIGTKTLRELNPHSYNIPKSPKDFIDTKDNSIEAVDAFIKSAYAYLGKKDKPNWSNPRAIEDAYKLKSFISGVKFDDYSLKGNRYLYRVAFPKERYLDWYEKDPGSKDIIKAFNKNIGDQEFPLRETPLSGRSLSYAMEVNAKDAFYQRNKHNLAASLDKEKEFVSENMLKAFEDAGFAGTKYRGDQQKGNFFNYVLQKPERARILDAFKFGVAGASLAPSFFSQPKVQTGRRN